MCRSLARHSLILWPTGSDSMSVKGQKGDMGWLIRVNISYTSIGMIWSMHRSLLGRPRALDEMDSTGITWRLNLQGFNDSLSACEVLTETVLLSILSFPSAVHRDEGRPEVVSRSFKIYIIQALIDSNIVCSYPSIRHSISQDSQPPAPT